MICKKNIFNNKYCYIITSFFYLLIQVYIIIIVKYSIKYKKIGKYYIYDILFKKIFINQNAINDIILEYPKNSRINNFSIKEKQTFQIQDSDNETNIYKNINFILVINYNYSFYFQYLIKNNSICPNNTNKCGIFDTLNNILCLPIDIECPINNIIIGNSSKFDKEKIPNIEYIVKKINKNSLLYYTNKAINETIISQFILSKYGICADPKKKNNKENENSCENRYINDLKYNPHYFKIDEDIETNYSLYASNFLGVNLDIKNKYKHLFEDLSTEISNTNRINENKYLILMYIKLFIAFIIFIFSILYGFNKRRNKYEILIKLFFGIYDIILLAISFIIFFYHMFRFDLKNFYNSDNLTNSIIKKAFKYYYIFRPLFIIGFIFNFIEIILICIDIIINCLYKKEKNDDKDKKIKKIEKISLKNKNIYSNIDDENEISNSNKKL